MVVIDEQTPAAGFYADDELDRLPWLADFDRLPSRSGGASPFALWPIIGAVMVALLSYFAAQASFAQAPGAQLTVKLPPPSLPHQASTLAGQGAAAMHALNQQAEAQYLAEVARELQQLESSDHPHDAAEHGSGR